MSKASAPEHLLTAPGQSTPNNAVSRPGLCVTAAIGATLGGIYAAQSFALGLTLARPLPFFDQWIFVADYFRYLNANYALSDLFNLHNEHRLLTTRLVLFADAIAFRMTGVFPIIVIYSALGAIAFLASTLAVGKQASTAERLCAFLIALGMAWSTVQMWNLTWPFQLQFPFIHLFALACYLALAASLTSTGLRAWLWLGVAGVADFLGVFSLGSGPVIGLPAIALAVWLRVLNVKFLIFLGVHAVLVGAYFWDFRFADGGDVASNPYGYLGWNSYVTYVIGFLGRAFGHGSSALFVGTLGLVLFLAFATVAFWIAVKKRSVVDTNITVLLTLAGFVVVEGMMVAVARAKFGVAPRYTTPSMVFVLCMLGCLWRASNYIGRAREGLQLGTLALASAAIIGTNLPRYEMEWRDHIAFIDRATAIFRKGEYPDDVLHKLFPIPQLDAKIKMLMKYRLGPFAEDPDPRN
jgi:hypothetical protein